MRAATLALLFLAASFPACTGDELSGTCKDKVSKSCREFTPEECKLPELNGCSMVQECYLPKCDAIAHSEPAWVPKCDGVAECHADGSFCKAKAGVCGAQCENCSSRPVCSGLRRGCFHANDQRTCNERKDCFWSDDVSI